MNRVSFYKALEDQVVSVPVTEISVDWGTTRGQGKRAGGQIRGGMSAAIDLQGVKIYKNKFAALPDYETHKADMHEIDHWAGPFGEEQYLKARSFGLDHDTAMIYVMEWTGESKAGSAYKRFCAEGKQVMA